MQPVYSSIATSLRYMEVRAHGREFLLQRLRAQRQQSLGLSHGRRPSSAARGKSFAPGAAGRGRGKCTSTLMLSERTTGRRAQTATMAAEPADAAAPAAPASPAASESVSVAKTRSRDDMLEENVIGTLARVRSSHLKTPPSGRRTIDAIPARARVLAGVY
jgi:hypothetical protein